MATDETLPIPDERSYQDGYSDGLASAKSMASADLHVLSLANALDALARHAAHLDNSGAYGPDDKCLECQTTVLLSRVVKFGDQLREVGR